MKSLIDIVNNIPDPAKVETEYYSSFTSEFITIDTEYDLLKLNVPNNSIVYCKENSKIYIYVNSEGLIPILKELGWKS